MKELYWVAVFVSECDCEIVQAWVITLIAYGKVTIEFGIIITLYPTN